MENNRSHTVSLAPIWAFPPSASTEQRSNNANQVSSAFSRGNALSKEMSPEIPLESCQCYSSLSIPTQRMIAFRAGGSCWDYFHITGEESRARGGPGRWPRRSSLLRSPHSHLPTTEPVESVFLRWPHSQNRLRVPSREPAALHACSSVPRILQLNLHREALGFASFCHTLLVVYLLSSDGFFLSWPQGALFMSYEFAHSFGCLFVNSQAI